METITQNLTEWLPRLLLALLALLILLSLRRVLSRLLVRPVRRFVQNRNAPLAEGVIDTLAQPMRLLVVALALYVSARIIQPDVGTSQFIQNLVRSLVIVAFLIGLYRTVDVFALSSNRLSAMAGVRLEERLVPLVRTGIKIVLLMLTVIIIMQEWGVDVTGLVASLGIVGLAFSLAAQDTVSNLFGFSTIVGDRPFTIGEYIITPDVEGVVEHVGIRSTRIRQPDRALITVPNNTLASAAVQRFARRRIHFVLGVTYETTADEMESLLEQLRQMLIDRQQVIDPTIAVYFTDFGDSSLDITIFCDVTIRDWRAYMEEREAINLSVMRIVAGLGLSVAFPTRSVYIEEMP